jgi:hypothetical protein
LSLAFDAYAVVGCAVNALEKSVPQESNPKDLISDWRSLANLTKRMVESCWQQVAAWIFGKAYEFTDPANMKMLGQNFIKTLLDPKKFLGTAEGIVGMTASPNFVMSKLVLVQRRDPRFDPFPGINWSTVIRPLISGCAPPSGAGWDKVQTAVEKADVTDDGLQDVLVTAGCPNTTSAWPENVYIFDGASPVGHPKHIGTLPKPFVNSDSWGDYLRDIEITTKRSTITIDANALSSRAPFCCPDLRVRLIYEWKKGKFVEKKRKVAKLHR